MNVKQLVEVLQKYGDDTEVRLGGEEDSDLLNFDMRGNIRWVAKQSMLM